MTPEARVQSKICSYLTSLQEKNLPLYWERRQAGGFNYKKGIPDLYVVFNGRHIEIETKAKNGKLSTMQEKWQTKCKKLNITYFCVNNYETFVCQFEKLITELF